MALLQVNFISQCLMRTVPLQVILPVDKITMPGQPKRAQKPFKTLYLLHGIFGNDTDWVTGTRIQAWAEAKNLAVVMPSGDNGFYVDHPNGERYGAFIGQELVEITRAMFPLSHQREDTFIAGLSMGGYGAIRNGLRYADTFGYVAGLSSAIQVEAFANVQEGGGSGMLIENRAFCESVFGNLDALVGSDMDPRALIESLVQSGSDVPQMYLCCGTEDFLLQTNRDYRDALKALHIPVTYEEGPGGHDWIFWDTYIKKILDWLPLEEANAGISSGNVRAK